MPSAGPVLRRSSCREGCSDPYGNPEATLDCTGRVAERIAKSLCGPLVKVRRSVLCVMAAQLAVTSILLNLCDPKE